MDRVVVYKITIIALFFIIQFLSLLLPLKIFSRQNGTFSRKTNLILNFCSCFSGGVFLGTCFFAMLPGVFHEFDHLFTDDSHHHSQQSYFSFCVVGGFFLTLIIEKGAHALSDRFGHGHGHSHDHHVEIHEASESSESPRSPTNLVTDSEGEPELEAFVSGHGHSHANHLHLDELKKLPDFAVRFAVLVFALGIHSVLEGIAVGLQTTSDALWILFAGVVVHEMLMAFALGVHMAKHDIRWRLVLQIGIVYSLFLSVGVAVGLGVTTVEGYTAQVVSAVLQAIALGTLFYVTFVEILGHDLVSSSVTPVHVICMMVGAALIGVISMFDMHGSS